MAITAKRKKASPKTKSNAGGHSCDPKLVKPLTAHLDDATLPGEADFDPATRRTVAEFILGTACERKADEATIAIETSSDGDTHRFTRIAIVNDDMPFLVDSVAALISQSGLVIDRLLHPVIPVVRDEAGKLTGLAPRKGAAADTPRESMIYIETARVDAKQRRSLGANLRKVLADVRAAVKDWEKLQAAMLADAGRIEDSEGADLLRWLNDGMLTQLGHITHYRDGSESDRLGICRKSTRDPMSDQSYDRAFEWFEERAGDDTARSLLAIKANHISNVHRRVPLDLFIVPIFEGAKVTALSIHAGVWTSAALSAPSDKVPRMRAQVAGMMEEFGFDPKGHAGKGLTHALTNLPHDLVIGLADHDVRRIATAMMGLVDRPRPRLALVEAPLSRHLFAFVWLPRDIISTRTRLRVIQMLEDAIGAKVMDWSLQVEGGLLATLRFVMDIRDIETVPDERALEEQLQKSLRGWGEAVSHELAEHEDPARAATLAARYAEAFPQSYRDDYGAAEAATDIRRLRALPTHESGRPSRDARLYRLPSDNGSQLRLKIYQLRGSLPLSDAVPALENFGFRVDAEIPTLLEDGALGAIHDFTLGLLPGDNGDAILERADAIERAIAEVLNGQSEDDVFNRLVVSTALSADDANLLRAFYRYLRQAGVSFTIYTVVDALRGAPAVTRALVALFAARNDPAFAGDRAERAAELDADIRSGLAKVQAINDDRLLRIYQAVIKAVLRTNFYAPAGEDALAFKIDSALVPGLPRPVPWREIFVYSQRVEGIHLRSGPVARGGLRWSSRRDDFRTEILGLMKAQRVKNAVIVPTGAKGGFYPKQLPDPVTDRDGWAAEGKESYKLFIRTLLSVTDNIVKDKVVHPDSVVVHDGEDPYFVVAADKGTATFSDTANAIAQERDFWLDDAFASGGSNGYDHKAMGITARGAWISVQRHFREMGVDVQKDPVRVVGCGDMSGDVFGNGMLLSKAIQLIAAFDHRHIFIDPNPDPAKSWKERQRLFQLDRSSWEDYDSKLISRGGGVFARSLKSIKLTAAMREALGTDVEETDPDTLIRLILGAPIELIWFGGIGTYIKSSRESHAEVGDPTNDGLRIDARDLKAKVIGEGANLGITQAGRIEFAMEGGRINTDFIDNSAGVDCSDNEVNIKIALQAARQASKLTERARNTLLADMTDEVAELVLDDNRHQALALSVAEAGGVKSAESHLRLIELLEDRDALDRKTEGLADGETLSRRVNEGAGLTRPELAVLLSTAKLVIQDAIEASALPDDPATNDMLVAAFPQPMRDKFRKQIENHRLRRELVATKLSNRIINRLGLIHPFELAEEEGASLAQIAAAFVATSELLGLDEVWDGLEHTAMPEDARIMLIDRAAAATSSHMADMLRTFGGTDKPSVIVRQLRRGVTELAGSTDELLSAEARKQSQALHATFTDEGAPAKAAASVAHLFDMDGSIGLSHLAQDIKTPGKKLTEAFIALGTTLGLDWAQQTAERMAPSDPWERLLVNGLSRDFQQMRLQFLRRIASDKKSRQPLTTRVEAWADANEAAVRQFRKLVARAQAKPPVTPAIMAQVASQARNLLAR